jgi:hypothetical protein
MKINFLSEMLVKKSLERRARRRVNQIIQIAVDQITQIAIILDLYPQGMLTNNKRNNFFLNFKRLNKLILILSFISISCNDNTITESVIEITRTSIPDTSIENYTISQELIADTLDIKNSIEYVSMGSIQGLDTSDKLYMVSFINKEFYGKNSFEVYCLPKIKFKELTEGELTENHFNDKVKKPYKNNSNYYYLVFEYPFINPDEAEDYHDTYVKLPCTIKVFDISNKNIKKKVGEASVKSFEELSEFKSKIILTYYPE